MENVPTHSELFFRDKEIKEAHESLSNAIATLNTLCLMANQEEIMRMEKTCEALLHHMAFLGRISTKIEICSNK